MKSETRNRKHEIRSTKSETNPKPKKERTETKGPTGQDQRCRRLSLSSSCFGFVSDFVLRISDFSPTGAAAAATLPSIQAGPSDPPRPSRPAGGRGTGRSAAG